MRSSNKIIIIAITLILSFVIASASFAASASADGYIYSVDGLLPGERIPAFTLPESGCGYCCPICGSENVQSLISYDESFSGECVECYDCGLSFTYNHDTLDIDVLHAPSPLLQSFDRFFSLFFDYTSLTYHMVIANPLTLVIACLCLIVPVILLIKHFIGMKQ